MPSFQARARACVRATLFALGALYAASSLAAPKTDVVVLLNGDRITGEIKGLEHNQLRFSTNHMGTVYVEWDKIARIESQQFLLLERSDGTRYYGQLVASGEDGELQVQREPKGRVDSVEMLSVVRAEPIVGGSIIDRLDGYVSAGFDTAKANDRRSLDFAAGLSSRTRTRAWVRARMSAVSMS